MDEWLAQVYGTNASEEELEKVAQLSLIEKLAEENDLDLSEFSPEEIEAIAEELFAEEAEDETEEEYEEADEDELAKEAQAKFEEADFLGRVMAHSYNQELEKIAGAGQAVKNWGQAAKHFAGKGAGAAKAGARDAAAAGTKWVRKNPKKSLGIAAGAGAVGGVAAGRLSKKASDVVEELAEERAIQILEDAGYTFENE